MQWDGSQLTIDLILPILQLSNQVLVILPREHIALYLHPIVHLRPRVQLLHLPGVLAPRASLATREGIEVAPLTIVPRRLVDGKGVEV